MEDARRTPSPPLTPSDRASTGEFGDDVKVETVPKEQMYGVKPPRKPTRRSTLVQLQKIVGVEAKAVRTKLQHKKELSGKEGLDPWLVKPRPSPKKTAAERRKRLASICYPRISIGSGENQLSTSRRRSSLTLASIEDVLSDTYIAERKELNSITLKMFPAIELFQGEDGALSARGMQQRTPEHFKKSVATATSLIRSIKDSSGANAHRRFRYFFLRAYAMQRLSQYELAIQDYTEAIQLKPECGAAFFNRAGCLWQLGFMSEALNDLDLAIKNEPTNKAFYEFRATLLRKIGKFDEATKDIFALRRVARGLHPATTSSRVEEPQRLPEDDQDFDGYGVLKMDPVSRSDEDIKRLQKSFKRIAFFDNLSPETVRSISRAITLSVYPRNSYVFHEGDKAEALFIILKGTVSVVKEIREENPELNKTKLVLLKLLYAGDSFGNVGLQQTNRKRTASVMTEHGCELLELDFDAYHHALGRHEDRIVRQRVEALQKFRIFKTWTYSKLLRLSSAIIVKNFEPSCVLLRQNQAIPALFLIKQGVCRVTKLLNTSAVDEDGEGTEGQGLSSWVLDAGWRRNTISVDSSNEEQMKGRRSAEASAGLTIGVLAPGQVFGELAVLDPHEKSPVNVVCDTAVELFEIRKEIIDEMELKFNSDTMTALQQSLRFHSPSEEKISYFFNEKKKWQKEKSRILNQLVSKNGHRDKKYKL